MQNYIFSLYIPNKLRIITIKFVKNIRNAFAISLFHALVFLKRDGVLFAFLDTLVVAHAFNVGIVVLTFHQELVQSLCDNQSIGIAAIEAPIFAPFKACYEQKELNHLQGLVVRIDVAGEVVDLFFREPIIRNAKKDEHTL